MFGPDGVNDFGDREDCAHDSTADTDTEEDENEEAADEFATERHSVVRMQRELVDDSGKGQSQAGTGHRSDEFDEQVEEGDGDGRHVSEDDQNCSENVFSGRGCTHSQPAVHPRHQDFDGHQKLQGESDEHGQCEDAFSHREVPQIGQVQRYRAGYELLVFVVAQKPEYDAEREHEGHAEVENIAEVFGVLHTVFQGQNYSDTFHGEYGGAEEQGQLGEGFEGGQVCRRGYVAEQLEDDGAQTETQRHVGNQGEDGEQS